MPCTYWGLINLDIKYCCCATKHPLKDLMVSQATHCIQELMFAMDITILNRRKLLLGNWGSEYGVIPKEHSWCMICVWKIPHSVLSKYQVIIWIRWRHIAPNPHGQLPFPKSCLILNVYGDPVSFCTRPGCNRTWIYIYIYICCVHIVYA